MKITVTKDDIRLGQKYMGTCTNCIIARAIRRTGAKKAEIGIHFVWSENNLVRFSLPKRVTKFINAACDRLPLKPFSFTIPDKLFNKLKEATNG